MTLTSFFLSSNLEHCSTHNYPFLVLRLQVLNIDCMGLLTLPIWCQSLTHLPHLVYFASHNYLITPSGRQFSLLNQKIFRLTNEQAWLRDIHRLAKVAWIWNQGQSYFTLKHFGMTLEKSSKLAVEIKHFPPHNASKIRSR